MIIIDYSDKRPIYEQIVERFRTLILNGALEPDEKLPSVRNLAIDLSINPNTIQKAYAELERMGFVYVVKGRGNFVCSDIKVLQLEKEKLLTEFRGDLKRLREIGITEAELVGCIKEVYKEANV